MYNESYYLMYESLLCAALLWKPLAGASNTTKLTKKINNNLIGNNKIHKSKHILTTYRIAQILTTYNTTKIAISLSLSPNPGEKNPKPKPRSQDSIDHARRTIRT
jgi:hypothetical protein